MGHPDFRVGGKIFSTLGSPDRRWGVVKLTPEQQQVLVQSEPGVFEPAVGAWGRRGMTKVLLANSDETTLRSAITSAWLNVAPKKLAEQYRKRPGE